MKINRYLAHIVLNGIEEKKTNISIFMVSLISVHILWFEHAARSIRPVTSRVIFHTFCACSDEVRRKCNQYMRWCVVMLPERHIRAFLTDFFPFTWTIRYDRCYMKAFMKMICTRQKKNAVVQYFPTFEREHKLYAKFRTVWSQRQPLRDE